MAAQEFSSKAAGRMLLTPSRIECPASTTLTARAEKTAAFGFQSNQWRQQRVH